MAIVSDRKMIYERKITELQTQLTEVSGSTVKAGWQRIFYYFCFPHRVVHILKCFSRQLSESLEMGPMVCLGLHPLICHVSHILFVQHTGCVRYSYCSFDKTCCIIAFKPWDCSWWWLKAFRPCLCFILHLIQLAFGFTFQFTRNLYDTCTSCRHHLSWAASTYTWHSLVCRRACIWLKRIVNLSKLQKMYVVNFEFTTCITNFMCCITNFMCSNQHYFDCAKSTSSSFKHNWRLIEGEVLSHWKQTLTVVQFDPDMTSSLSGTTFGQFGPDGGPRNLSHLFYVLWSRTNKEGVKAPLRYTVLTLPIHPNQGHPIHELGGFLMRTRTLFLHSTNLPKYMKLCILNTPMCYTLILLGL